jgi:acyl carrier protein
MYLRERVAAVLRLSIDKVDIQEPLNNLGIDSLMAVELKKRIEVDLGVSIRIVYFLLGHNVVHLAEQINEQLSDAGETLNDDQLELRSPEELLAAIDKLSDAEVDSLLASVIRNEEVKIEL